jgi:ABC-type multidrug transport system ATPase subunit
MDDSVVLEVDGLSKTFGEKTVLKGITTRLRAGDRLGLSGPNGSGKTTFLRCVAGTVTPSSGTVTILGHPGGTTSAQRAIGGALALERAFYQRLSGWKNLMFYAALRTRSDRAAREDVESLVDELELAPFIRERVDRYSSGMCQQLGLARALLGSPALLILDEPTRSLDTEAVGRFWKAIDARPSVTVLIASHRNSDLDRCSQRIDLS